MSFLITLKVVVANQILNENSIFYDSSANETPKPGKNNKVTGSYNPKTEQNW